MTKCASPSRICQCWPCGSMTRTEVRLPSPVTSTRSTSLPMVPVTATSDLSQPCTSIMPATLSISTAPCGLAARCSSTEVAACASHGNARVVSTQIRAGLFRRDVSRACDMSNPCHGRLGGLNDAVVQVKFVMPGALPKLFEHLALWVSRQRLADIFVRLLDDRQTGFDFRAGGRLEQCEPVAESLLHRIARKHVFWISRLVKRTCCSHRLNDTRHRWALQHRPREQAGETRGHHGNGGCQGHRRGVSRPAGKTRGDARPQIPGGHDLSRQTRNQPIKGIWLAIIHVCSNPSVEVSSWRARCSCALQVPSAIPNTPAASAWLYP